MTRARKSLLELRLENDIAAVAFRQETRERLNSMDDRLAAIESMLAEYLAAQDHQQDQRCRGKATL